MAKANNKATGPIKVGLAGVGRAGWQMHTSEVSRFPDKFTFVASLDPNPERMAQMTEKYGAKSYRKYEDLINDPDVELVDIATRSPDHVEKAIAALKAGKYVFLEKPIAITYKGALELKKAAAKYKNKLYFRHNRRFEPAFQHIREIIASGILGDVYEIKLRRHGYSRRDDWQTIIKEGGGQLNNWGPHIVDHSLRFLESPVADIWSDLKRVAAVGDAEDHLKIVLRGKNGRIVDMEISGGAAISEPVYIIFGSKGALTSDEKTIRIKYLDPAVKLPPRKATRESPPYGTFGTPEQLPWKDETFPVAPATGCNTPDIWNHLYAAIREGKKFPITTDEAVEVVRIIDLVKKGTKFANK